MADAEPDTPARDGAADGATPASPADSADSADSDTSAARDAAPTGDTEPDTAPDTGLGADPGTETGGGPAEGASAEVPASGDPKPIGGTVPPWWTWVGRHRKPVALVAVLVVVAVVGTVVTVSLTRERPRDVVRSYLDAIRSGDTRAALEIAGEPGDDARLRFLSADALADDWAVDAIAERHVREDEADVDVTLSAGNVSRQGRFHVVRDEDGWRIESPFVKVDLTVPDLDVVELGGVRQPAPRGGTTRTVPLLLFPGVYELYPSFGDRLAFDPALFIAVPHGSGDATVPFTAAYTLSEAGAEAAQKAVNASVDECAAQAVRRPPGCPFDVTEASVMWELDEVTDVAWTVVAHPVAHFATGNDGGIDLVVRKPGTVRVTGTGVPDGGGARTPFTLTCEFGLDNLAVAVRPDDIVIERVLGDEYAAAFSTRCV